MIEIALIFLGWFLGLATAVVGVDRIRVWIGLTEREPYYTSVSEQSFVDKDPVIGPIVKARRAAGDRVDWFLPHHYSAKVEEGYEYLRYEKRRVMLKSKTLAHGDELVLMVLPAGGPSPRRGLKAKIR